MHGTTNIKLSSSVALIRRTSGRRLGAFRQSNPLSDIEERWTQRYFEVVLVNKLPTILRTVFIKTAVGRHAISMHIASYRVT